ncbi:PHD finger protein rhinoceros-like [Forsythia ovata]|uniref:PHD finger protein rhinoceros-like n=1 Tax=Forsythia ovata TaxID=205694 RepID=A0ABD1WK17_9LAMI
MTTIVFFFMIFALAAFSSQPALALKTHRQPSHAEAPPSNNPAPPHHAAAAPSPAVFSEYTMPPESNFVDACLRKITSECEIEIFNSIFINNSVSDKCCRQLVDMGRRCHEDIFKTTLTLLPDLNGRERTRIMKRNVETWDQCVLVTNTEDSSPLPSLFS